MNRFAISALISFIAAFVLCAILMEVSSSVTNIPVLFESEYGGLVILGKPHVYRCHVVGQQYSTLNALSVDFTGAYYDIDGVVTHLNNGQTFCYLSELHGNWSTVFVL